MRLLAPFALLIAVLGAVLWYDEAPPEADLVFVNRNEIFTLDPQRMSWMQDFRMAYAVYEGLVRWNNDDFTILPAGATWTESADGLTWTFSLREDARWSNGDPVTAHDFVYAWQRALLPDSAADYSAMFFAIEGAEAFFTWRREQTEAFATQHRDTDTGDPLALWERTQQRFSETVGLETPDDRTLIVRLVRPVPYFLDLLAFPVWYPVHRPTVEGWSIDQALRARIRDVGWHAVEAPDFTDRRWVRLDPATGRLEQKHRWMKADRFVGNGPYVIADWRYKRGLRLERNTQYHTPDLARCDSIAALSIEDVNTSVLAFESGGVDWLTDVNAIYKADLLREREAYVDHHRAALGTGPVTDAALAALPEPESGERRNIHAIPAFGTDFYSFNCRPTLVDGGLNPFHDARVRRAFALAVDKEAIVRQVTRLGEPVARTLIPPGSIPGYTSPEGLGYDVELARATLADAGWIDRDKDGIVENEEGVPFPPVDVLYSTNTPRYENISLALRDMWQRELGVTVALRGKDSKAFKEDLKRGHFMLGRGRWYGDYGDPTTFLDISRTGNGNNDRGFSHPDVDRLLDDAALERDPERRMAILSECERLVVEEHMPFLVLCQLVELYMYEPDRVRGMSHHPRLVQYLWQLERSGS